MAKCTEYFDSYDDFLLCLKDAEAEASRGPEIDFVAELSDRVDQYGKHTALSLKQANWLRRIADWEEV